MERKKEKSGPNAFTPVMGVIVLLLALVLWLNFGSVLALFFYAWPGGQSGIIGILQPYIAVHIPFILMFMGLWFGSNALLRTKLRELLGASGGFRWGYALKAGLIYLAIAAALTLMRLKNVTVSVAPLQEKLLFIIPVLLLTPMQAVSEELFFRALPARIVYRDTLPETPLRALPLSVISGLLFLIPSGGFEAPCAMHAANNLYIALLVNYPGSAMPTSSLFTDSSGASSISSMISMAAAFILIYLFSLHGGYVREGFRWQGRKQES